MPGQVGDHGNCEFWPSRVPTPIPTANSRHEARGRTYPPGAEFRERAPSSAQWCLPTLLPTLARYLPARPDLPDLPTLAQVFPNAVATPPCMAGSSTTMIAFGSITTTTLVSRRRAGVTPMGNRLDGLCGEAYWHKSCSCGASWHTDTGRRGARGCHR